MANVALEGFSLNAKVLIKKNDREGLEYLCRYIARPAISNERLSLSPNGNVIFQLKRSFNDGTTHVSFTAVNFIKRLIALIPPPRAHTTRYHGVFAPNAKDRSSYVRKTSEGESNVKSYRLSWAKLMAKVFKVDVEKCHCGGKLKLVATILAPKVILAILKLLNIEIYFPQPAAARSPPLFSSGF